MKEYWHALQSAKAVGKYWESLGYTLWAVFSHDNLLRFSELDGEYGWVYLNLKGKGNELNLGCYIREYTEILHYNVTDYTGYALRFTSIKDRFKARVFGTAMLDNLKDATVYDSDADINYYQCVNKVSCRLARRYRALTNSFITAYHYRLNEQHHCVYIENYLDNDRFVPSRVHEPYVITAIRNMQWVPANEYLSNVAAARAKAGASATS